MGFWNTPEESRLPQVQVPVAHSSSSRRTWKYATEKVMLILLPRTSFPVLPPSHVLPFFLVDTFQHQYVCQKLFFSLVLFHCDQIHIASSLPSEPFLTAQFSGVKHLHLVVQPSPPSIPRTSSSSQTETLSPLDNNPPSLPQPVAPTILTFCL